MPLIFLGILTLVLGACVSSSPAPDAAKATEAETPKSMTVAVRTPVRQAIRRSASLTAEFRPYQQVDLHAKISGYLKRITVDVGGRVRAGDVIATLEAPELQAELDQAVATRSRAESETTRAKAEIAQVESALELAKAQYDRLMAVNKREAGLIAQQEIDEVMARRRAADAQAAAARAHVMAAEQQVAAGRAAEARVKAMLDYTRVTAPFNGVVVKRYVDQGALIQAGVSSASALPLVKLAEMDRLRLVANVPEAIAGRIKLGQAVQVKIPALNQTLSAKFARFTENMQASTRTTEVEIDVANGARGILPGMVADVVVDIDSAGDALTIPVQAVANLGGNRTVLVVNANGVLEERPIKTGFEGATEFEVISGLSETDRVVTSSRTLLQPGMKVDAKTEAAK